MKSVLHHFTYMLCFVTVIILFPVLVHALPVQKFAQLGDFKLESGELIKNCVVGYNTCGKLNADHSNAILILTWFGGSSRDLLFFASPGMLADSTKYFVVTIDAPGNGVSSSPSNSKLQPNESFPHFNVRDMVKSEYFIASNVLGLKHVFCIIGSSMGGMQTFQWLVSYPEFMDKAVIEVGTPKLTSNDLLLWNSELLAIEEGLKCNASLESITNTVAAIHTLNLQTPDYYVDHVSSEEFPKYLKNTENDLAKSFNPYNWMSQLCAMINHNIFYLFNNDMKKVAAIVKAKVFIVVCKQDRMVNPRPALNFAKLIKAETLELDNNCGHYGVGCEMEKVVSAINKFLSN
ncbi:MAG: alpha/beta fold hydrolase [Ignavibacteriales bacterium]|nr:alpha/beta fold hydrolase [Ignavibacteriales bacterium]